MNTEQINFYQQKLAYEIDAADLFEAIKDGKNFIVIDTRKTFAFEKQHLPGAINLPHREMNEKTTSELDPQALYVCYCDGIGCNASTKGALNMAKLGFRVKELLGGIEWWKFDGYATKGTNESKGNEIQCAC